MTLPCIRRERGFAEGRNDHILRRAAPVIVPCAVALLLVACASPSGGVVTATPNTPRTSTPAATTPPDRPAYSADEVRAYVLSNPPHGNKITTSAAPGYTVAAVTLTTIAQFDLDFGTGTQAPPETLIYAVELAGQFTMSGGPPRLTMDGTVTSAVSNTYPSYVDVFDAHTGRLIIEGGFARQ